MTLQEQAGGGAQLRETEKALYRCAHHDESSLDKDQVSIHHGISIRCIKGPAPQVPTIQTSAENVAALPEIHVNILGSGGMPITEKGICWGTSPNPTKDGQHISAGNGSESFSKTITNLSKGTKYYVRGYAVNMIGTGYGNEVAFSTNVFDFSGVSYKTISIGSQIWMAENLRAVSFNDGTSIDNVVSDDIWKTLSAEHHPAYCWYNNDADNKYAFGALYNQSVVDGVNGKDVCPAGWHIPGNRDWFTLITFIDPDANYWGIISDFAGDRLKEAGNINWHCDNKATGETGFNALPGGKRYISDPPFSGLGNSGIFWSKDSGKFIFNCEDGSVSFSEGGDDFGFSIRCVKNQ